MHTQLSLKQELLHSIPCPPTCLAISSRAWDSPAKASALVPRTLGSLPGVRDTSARPCDTSPMSPRIGARARCHLQVLPPRARYHLQVPGTDSRCHLHVPPQGARNQDTKYWMPGTTSRGARYHLPRCEVPGTGDSIAGVGGCSYWRQYQVEVLGTGTWIGLYMPLLFLHILGSRLSET